VRVRACIYPLIFLTRGSTWALAARRCACTLHACAHCALTATSLRAHHFQKVPPRVLLRVLFPLPLPSAVPAALDDWLGFL
jgi:hypothetical protein